MVGIEEDQLIIGVCNLVLQDVCMIGGEIDMEESEDDREGVVSKGFVGGVGKYV
jgi:hypothetical protein